MKGWAGIGSVAAVIILVLGTAGNALAHCDTLDGPVVNLAQQALAKGDVKIVLPWVAADLVIAQTIDWVVQGSTYGRYNATAGGGTAPFGVSLSVCAVSDIDGDATLAGVALWQPQLGVTGVPTATGTPVAAPCSAAPDITNHDMPWLATDPMGQVVTLSADSIF